MSTSNVPPRLRSMLYAPANRPGLIAKVPRYETDRVVIDLEDGTTPRSRQGPGPRARPAGSRRDDWSVRRHVSLRVNGPAELGRFADDLACLSAGAFDGIVVPKIETFEQGEAPEQTLSQHERHDRPVICGIETFRGVDRSTDGDHLRSGHMLRRRGLHADLGGPRTSTILETLYARTSVWPARWGACSGSTRPSPHCATRSKIGIHHSKADSFGTAFTVTMDAKDGINTGISATGRANTIRLLNDAGAHRARLTGPRRLAIGPLGRLVDPRHAKDEAPGLAHTLCGSSGAALTQIMRYVDDADDLPLDDGLATETRRVPELFGGPTPREGLRTFIEKRRPDDA
jgi:hypothetical protein